MENTNTTKGSTIPIFIQKLNSIERREQFRNLFHISLLTLLLFFAVYFFIAYKNLAANSGISNEESKALNVNESPQKMDKMIPFDMLLETESISLSTKKTKVVPIEPKSIVPTKKLRKPAKEEPESNGITFGPTPR